MSSDEEEESFLANKSFEPVVTLPEVEPDLHEDNETCVFERRAKLYRLHKTAEEQEWKERGVGNIRILVHKETKHARIVMRREKVMKLCANHRILSEMRLFPNKKTKYSFLWSTPCDFADLESKTEIFAVKFQSPEDADLFSATFDDARDGKVNVDETVEEKAITESVSTLALSNVPAVEPTEKLTSIPSDK